MICISPDEPNKLTIPDRIADLEDDLEDNSGDELGQNPEDEWTDETEDDSDIDSMMSEIERELFGDDDDESSSCSEDTFDEDGDEEDSKRHLAIVRTNQQIHSEAMSMFYREAVLALEPGDIFSLSKKPKSLTFGFPNEMAWKHNPLDGISKMDKNGVVVYDTASLSGDIEPHIFAKFQRISFDAYFDDDHTQLMEMWIDDDTRIFRADDAAELKKTLQSSNLIKDLVKILSNSPRITSLEVSLEVEVMANSNLIMADLMYETDDEDDEVGGKTEKIMDIANEKATELFLDSGIMDPLKTLSNVSSCNFKFGFEHRDEGDEYKPPGKYVKLLRDLKDTIESNFKDSMVES